MESLPGLDAAFLALETSTSHLHVGAALVFEGVAHPTASRYELVRGVVASRLALVPPFRQRAVRIPCGLEHPVWVDDPEFDLDDHLGRASLPAPGGVAELEDFVADFMSRPLDANRPLWEMVVVEGLADDRTALVVKIHHAILDGVSAASLMAAFFDLEPVLPEPAVPPAGAWEPTPLPSNRELIFHAASAMVRRPGILAGVFSHAVDAMVEIAGRNRELAAAGAAPPPAPFAAPRTSLNGTISSRRHYATAAFPMDEVRAVGRAFGATINDVLLAVVSGALRELLVRRGESLSARLVAAIPVSTRPEAARDQLGNSISMMLVSLATDLPDPVARLRAVAQSASVAKEQERVTEGRLLADMSEVFPPSVVALAIRLAGGTHLFDRFRPIYNVMVSNVPGPEVPLWCGGGRIEAVYPLGPIAEGAGLNITTLSYLGTLYLGLFGCRRLVPDLSVLGELVGDSLGELVAVARSVGPGTSGSPRGGGVG